MCVCAVGGLPDSRATPLTRTAEEKGKEWRAGGGGGGGGEGGGR